MRTPAITGLLAGLLVSGTVLATDLVSTSLDASQDPADAIFIRKSERVLELVRRGEILRRYRISLGAEPTGHKSHEGDERTPEGRYFIDWRNPDSRFYKALHISYPNPMDRFQAELTGVDPGGMVMIHGMPSAPELGWIDTRGDWTDGCIAVDNLAMDEIWAAVEDGTPVVIKP